MLTKIIGCQTVKEAELRCVAICRMHAPGATLRTREVSVYGLAADFESVAHARQQSVEPVIAEIDFAAKKLADAGLPDTTGWREL